MSKLNRDEVLATLRGLTALFRSEPSLHTAIRSLSVVLANSIHSPGSVTPEALALASDSVAALPSDNEFVSAAQSILVALKEPEAGAGSGAGAAAGSEADLRAQLGGSWVTPPGAIAREPGVEVRPGEDFNSATVRALGEMVDRDAILQREVAMLFLGAGSESPKGGEASPTAGPDSGM